MNGMQLGDKKLIVQRASVGAKIPGGVCILRVAKYVFDIPVFFMLP